MVTLIGMGSGKWEALSAQAQAAVGGAGLVFGAKRLLAGLPADCTARQFALYQPSDILETLAQNPGQDAAVLYSGDTGFYSGASGLLTPLRALGIPARVYPGVSSIQLLSAALGRPWQDWRLVSAHGCACGAVTGFFVATFRLSPFIVSMTMQLAYKGIALTFTNQTPVSVPHPVLQAINNIKLFNIFPIVFFFFLLLAVLTELFLRNTQFGRNLFLVGGNISVADNLGIKARNYIWSAYIFQGLFAAIGGVVMMTRQFSASGNLALQGPMEVIPMVIVGGTSMAGGRGGALKTVGGVVLLKIIYNAMTMFSIPAPLQPFVKGLILLVVIVSDKYMERRHEKV